MGKETGKTSYIERFNNTLRQRVGRLVGKTLSFSKKLENHIGAVWYFVHHYNALLRASPLLFMTTKPSRRCVVTSQEFLDLTIHTTNQQR